MHVNNQGKQRREKSSVLSLFLKVDRQGAEVTLGYRLFHSKRVQQQLGKLGHQLSRVSCVERAALTSIWIEVSDGSQCVYNAPDRCLLT